MSVFKTHILDTQGKKNRSLQSTPTPSISHNSCFRPIHYASDPLPPLPGTPYPSRFTMAYASAPPTKRRNSPQRIRFGQYRSIAIE